METLTQKRKWGISITVVLAGILLLCFLMGNAAPVMASDAEDTVGMSEENNYGADVLVPVDVLLQNPDLPNGCEATALSMLMRHRGYKEASKMMLAYNYLEKELFSEVPVSGQKEPKLYCGDPEKVFCGDPGGKTDGYYCFQGPIVEAANKYIKEQDSRYTAIDMSGAPESALTSLLDQGTPVMIWCTLKMDAPRLSTKKAWTISETGKEYTPYSNLHSMVLVGYNNDSFYLNDPLQGLVTCSREAVMSAYTQMGSRAVVLL